MGLSKPGDISFGICSNFVCCVDPQKVALKMLVSRKCGSFFLVKWLLSKVCILTLELYIVWKKPTFL